ncbi:hypothetical protein IKD57_00710 [Candidatus Saccharibacteria bacterium]|nr:hypothetical protein [Candidatus Saccharibacteria bacterium]
MNKNYYTRTTVSIWCEGDRDASFVKYLYGLYHVPGREVKIRNAHGGDPAGQVRQMVKYYLTRDFDEKYALYDLDRGKESVGEARRMASANGIICLESDKCLEMELVRLISDDGKLARRACRSSVEAKKVFAELCHLKHLDDAVEWERWADKKRFNDLLSASKWLTSIINAIEEGE